MSPSNSIEPASTSAPSPPASPPWSPATKIVVGVSVLAALAALLIAFRDFIGPLVLALMLAYLMHPLAGALTRWARLSWRTAVAVVYLLLAAVVLALLAAGGFALVQQAEGLYGVVQDFLLTDLPHWLQYLSTHTYAFGPWVLDFRQYDFNALNQQLLTSVQPLIGQLGTLVSRLAASTLQVLGWLAFVWLTSYFLLAESGRVSSNLVTIRIPGYQHDLERMGKELGRIWNAFLRGQLTVAAIAMVWAWLWLTVVGAPMTLVLASLAAIARFVPYVGPFVLYTITALAILLQPTAAWGLQPWQMALVTVGGMFVGDNIIDNFVTPRILGEALGVHPAAVLVTALVGAKLFGVLGLLFAAPTLASLRLFGHYIMRKMFDQDPWADWHTVPPYSLTGGLVGWLGRLYRRLRRRPAPRA
jgi:predicted PurR-regulated permease PerM